MNVFSLGVQLLLNNAQFFPLLTPRFGSPSFSIFYVDSLACASSTFLFPWESFPPHFKVLKELLAFPPPPFSLAGYPFPSPPSL